MKTIISIILIMTIGFTFTACSEDAAEMIDCPRAEPYNCDCYAIYDPVCGCDGVLYSNACMAECNGILTYTEGECN